MGALKLEEMLLPSVIKVLEDNDVKFSVDEQVDMFVAELEFYSEYEGDQLVSIWFDYDEEDCEDAKFFASDSFADGLQKYYENFDVDEYVRDWLDAKQSNPNVCYLNARQLVEDAESVDKFLEELVIQVKEALTKND